MDLTQYQHTETITIDRSPEDVYGLVSDVERMGEWSPVCTGGAWDEDRSWFTGSNAIGEFTWDTRCRVEAAEPGKEFTFVNCGAAGDVDLVRWSFTLRPADRGTEVTETWQVLPDYEDFVRGGDPEKDVTPQLEGMKTMAQTGMAETLAKMKATAEGA